MRKPEFKKNVAAKNTSAPDTHSFRFCIVLFLAVLFFLCANTQIWAIDYTWTGSGGAGISNRWDAKQNWTPNTAAPSTGDSVTIPAGIINYPSLNDAVTVTEITIESGGSLNTDIHNLTLTGTLTNNGAFVMNGGTVTAASVSGSGTFSLSGIITTKGGAQNYGGEVTVTGTATINTTGADGSGLVDNGGNGGSVTFGTTVTLNAALSIIASGGNGSGLGSGGTGGTVTFSNTVTLNAALSITANGGNGSGISEGKGGSVTFNSEVRLTDTLSIETKGGSKWSTPDSANGDVSFVTIEGGGNLTVNNTNNISVAGAIGSTTPLNSVTLGAATGTITINSSSVTLSGNWNNNSGKTTTLSSILFTGSSPSAITGTNTFTTFTCNTQGKTISFPATVTTIGTFNMEGTSTSYITMQGTSGAPWNLNFTGSTGNRTAPNLKYVSVKMGNLSAGNSVFVFADRIQSSGFTPVSGTLSWMFGMGTLRKWTGAASTVWIDGANWDGNVVPDPGDDVEIPTVVNQPVIPSGGVSITDAIISGDVNGSDTFKITGNLSITGATTMRPPLAVTGETIIDTLPIEVSLENTANSFIGAITVTKAAKLTLKAGNSVSFAALNTRDNVVLDISAGTVTQTALINTSQLSLSGNATYTLTHADNTVSTLAAGAGSGDIQFTCTNGSTLDVGSVGTINVINGITRTGNVTLDVGTSKLAIKQPITAQSFIQSGLGEVTFAANVTTTKNQSYAGLVKLGANVTLQSTSDGNITFSNTLNSDSTAHTLTLAAAGTGKITFNGETGTVIPLPTLAITAANTVNFNANLKADALAFSGAGTSANLVFNGRTGGQSITVNVPQNSFNTVTGTITIGNHVNDSTSFTNGFMQTAAGGAVTLAGEIITTAATAPIEFTSGVIFTRSTSLKTTNGNIILGGTLQSGSSGSNLKLTAGTGNIEFKGIVGTAGIPNAFGLDIVSAQNVTASNELFVKGLRQQAGSGKTTLTGKITTTDDIVSIITGDIEIHGGIAMGSPALCTLINSGLLQIKGEINNAGTFAQLDGNPSTATDRVELGANITTTNNNAISFASPITLTADVSINNGTGLITFSKTVDSDTSRPSELTLVSSGIQTFNGAVGSITPLASLTTGTGEMLLNANITTSANIATKNAQTYNGLVTINAPTALIKNTGSSNIIFNRAVTINPALSLQNTTGSIGFYGAVTASENLTIEALNTTFFVNYSQSVGKTLVLNSGVVYIENGIFTANTIEINNCKVNVKDKSFISGNISLTGTATFTQTGNNTPSPPNTQSVGNITLAPGTSMTWAASTTETTGGTLEITGNIISAGAGATLDFGFKNVIFRQSTSIGNFVLFDLTIPSGITLTLSDFLRVRRNVTIDGSYQHGGKKLTLGGTDSSDGTIKDTKTTKSDLGIVEIDQGSTKKTFDGVKISNMTWTGPTQTGTIDIINECSLGTTGGIVENTTGAIKIGNSDTDVTTFPNGFTQIAAGGTVTLAGTIKTTSATAPLTFTGNTILAANTVLDTTTGNGTITFDKTVNNITGTNYSLTLAAGTGDMEFKQAVGNTTPVGSITVQSVKGATFSAAVTTSNFTITNSGVLTIGANATITATGGFTQTGSGTVSLGANITTTNNNVSFASLVTLTENASVSTGTGIGDITFKSAINGSAKNLTLTAGTGAIQFAASVTVQTLLITPANPPETAPNVYISGSATFSVGTAEIYFPSNLFIAAPSSDTVRFSGTVKTGGSLVLFSGKLLPDADIIVQKDLVLLNGSIPSMFAGNGFAGLFGYNAQNMDVYAAARGTLTAAVNVPVFPAALPDGTPLNHATGNYSGSFDLNALSGKTLSAAGNFYANGVQLNPSGNWTLKLADNANTTSAFAESYNLTAAHCTVESLITGGFSWISAAENCTDGGNNTATANTGWAFRRPEILGNNTTIATGTALSGTYTVYDDVIRVEFSYNTTPNKTSAKIENSHNEISAALAATQFNNNAAPFKGAFIDPDCVNSTDGKGDLSVFYLRTGTDASNGLRWNTDATGNNVGNAQSTDRGRIGESPKHQNTLPNISIPFALANLYQTLRDNYKNRIATVLNFDTADRCRPVLIETRTGQELHTVSVSAQEPYDSHNFMELRYSEAVRIGGLAETAKNVKASLSFATATEWGGAITEHTDDGFAITGYIQTQKGTLKTGSRTSLNPPTIKQNDPEVHALYRFFSQNLLETAQAQTHRLRISIAGFSSGTVSGPDRVSVPFWGGYIDSSVTPKGSVSVIANSHITDLSAAFAGGNILEPTENNNIAYGQTGSASYPKYSVSINSAEQTNTVYGEWDTSPPVFASYNPSILGWGTEKDNEILGIDSTSTGYIDAMEFHFFDNTPQKDSTDPFYGSNYWVSKFGWMPVAGNGFLPPTNTSFAAQDITGGARVFSSDTAVRTAGGVRSSSLYGSLGAFSYGLNNDGSASLFSPFEGVLFSQRVTTTGFFGTYNKRSTDNLYLRLSLLSADRMQYNPRQTFSIKYDTASGFVTDLAGNRMKKTEGITVDRVPPKFSMTILPVEGQELFILFNKPLQIAPANLSKIPSQFEIFDKTDSSVKNNIINTSVAAKVRYNTLDATALILTLNQSNPDGPITFEKILKYGLRTVEGELEPDSLTGQLVRQPQIFDTKGNAMVSHATHQLSDFGVFAATPLFALSTPVVTNGVTGPDFEALRNFNGGGKLFSETSSTFEIRLAFPSLSGSPSNLGALTMFAGTNPSTGSVSETFNKNTGASLKIWLPEAMPVISSSPNTNHKTISEDSPLNNNLRKFLLLKAASFDWKSGDTVEFLFKYKNPNYIPDPSKEPYEEPMPYIYCLRLANPSDIASLDLWRFDLFDLTRQRGGTTILNNVINANTREETVLEVAMPKAGNLNISVMTIDGNIVKVLHRGRADAGTSYYRWDGTNNGGRTVSRGMYFIRISGTDIDETRKVMVVYD